MAKISLESIVKDICYAQVCSDSGKRIREIKSMHYYSNIDKCVEFGYEDKNFYILRAIEQIRHSQYVGVNYYISKENYENLIVYFNIKVNGKKFQMSFHAPGFNNKCLRKYYDPTRKKIRWNTKYSCRENCKELMKIFNI